MSVIFGVKTPAGALLAADTRVQQGTTIGPPCGKIVVYTEQVALACCGEADVLDVLRDHETRQAIEALTKEYVMGPIAARLIRKALRRALMDAGFRPTKEGSPMLVSANFILACGPDVSGISGAMLTACNPATDDHPFAFGAGAQAALGSWWTSSWCMEGVPLSRRAGMAVQAAAGVNAHCGGHVDLWSTGSISTYRGPIVSSKEK